MRWNDVRAAHPDRWLVIEALDAHSEHGRRVLDRIAVVEVCADGGTAQRRYRELHGAHAERELYFAHARNAELIIDERPVVRLRLEL